MEKKIRILPGGPYEVTPDIPLVQAIIVPGNEEGVSESWRAGKQYPATSEEYTLCRCGYSESKPFCDGSHTCMCFNKEEVATHDTDTANTKRYEGPEIDLIDEESLCALLRFCDRGITIWDAVAQSDAACNKELAIQEACACAAGRLTVVKKDGTPCEPELPQEISPIQDTAEGCRGPLWVKGGIVLEGADGKTYKIRNRMTLCRCGQSNNMPFCDASHLKCPHMQGVDE